MILSVMWIDGTIRRIPVDWWAESNDGQRIDFLAGGHWDAIDLRSVADFYVVPAPSPKMGEPNG